MLAKDSLSLSRRRTACGDRNDGNRAPSSAGSDATVSAQESEQGISTMRSNGTRARKSASCSAVENSARPPFNTRTQRDCAATSSGAQVAKTGMPSGPRLRIAPRAVTVPPSTSAGTGASGALAGLDWVADCMAGMGNTSAAGHLTQGFLPRPDTPTHGGNANYHREAAWERRCRPGRICSPRVRPAAAPPRLHAFSTRYRAISRAPRPLSPIQLRKLVLNDAA